MKKSLLLWAAFLVASFSFAVPEYRELPADYVQVETIESTGSQYINTGVAAGANVSAVLDFTPREYTGEVNIGTQPGNDSKDWRFFNYSGGSMFDIGSRRIGYNTTPNTVLTNGDRYTVELSNASVRVLKADGSLQYEASATPVNDNDIIHANIFVCANNNGSSVANYVRMVIHSLTMKDLVGGAVQTVRDFVPCYRLSDGEPGLYDLVSRTFFSNPAQSPNKFLIGAEVECPDPSSRIVTITGFENITVSDCAVQVTVLAPTWTGEATLTVRYGTDAENLLFSETRTISDTATTLSIPLKSLKSGTEYYVAAEIVPLVGDSVVTLPKRFVTLAEKITNRAGLYQAYVTQKAWDTEFDIANASGLGRTLGAEAAHSSATGATWPVYYANGTQGTTQWGNNTTFGYIGYMYLTGETLTVGAKMDDNVRLIIDGTMVIDQSGNTLKTATYTPTNGPGWYPIEIRVGNGSGGYGPYGGFKGLCWNTTNYTGNDTSDNWNLFMDPGDGSLLRTEPYFNPPILRDVWTYANGAFSGIVDCEPTVEGGELRLYAADLHGGDDIDAWTLVETQPLAVTPDPQAIAFEDVELPADANLARFYLIDSATGMIAWSKTVPLKAVQDPQVSIEAAEDITGTSVTLPGSLGRLGVPGDVTITATLTPTLADAAEDALTLVMDEEGPFEFALENLVPGTEYSYSYQAINAGGFVAATTNVTFTTPAGSSIVSNSFSSLDRSVHIHAGLDFGAGTTEAAISFGAAGTTPTLYPVTIGEDGTIDLDITGLSWGTKYSYEVVVSNTVTSANGTVYSWTDRTGLLDKAITIYDTETYTWRGLANGGVDEGDWAVAANWISSAADAAERPGYPTDNSIAIFPGSSTYVVTLNDSVALNSLRITGPMDITFRANQPNVTLSAASNSNYAGMKVRVVGISLLIPTGGGAHEFYVSQAGYLRWTTEFPQHNGALISLSEHSTFYHHHETYPGPNGYNMIVDDSMVDISRWFCHSETNLPGTQSRIVVKGRSPYIFSYMFQPRGAYPCAFIFSIPIDGYEMTDGHRSPVFGNGSFMSENLWGLLFYTGCTVELDPESPILKQGEVSSDQLLIDTDYFGLTEEPSSDGYRRPVISFDNSTLPEGCYFYFKDKNGNILTAPSGKPLPGVNMETARQLWVHTQSQRRTLLLIR